MSTRFMSYKILLADGQPVIHLGVRAAFARESDFEIVSVATESDEIGSEVQRHQPNLLITESRIGGRDALKVLEQIMPSHKDMLVIVFSENADACNVARAGALGCYEYISKSLPCEALVAAAKNGINGVPPKPDGLSQAAKLRLKDRRLPENAQSVLTPREMQVIRHIAMGLKNREIGFSLEISVETVKEHVQNILRKLQVNDRTQAAVKAHKNGWV
jgi:DNA-binding NarL/FixJ family response regulator